MQKNRDKVDVVLVVCDLDRASNHDGSGNRAERMNLQKTINYYENTNIKNNFFFTFPCFETWLAAGLNISASNLYRHLGYQNTDDGKTDSKLLEKYVKSGGDFVMAAQYFVNKPLYFVKKDFTMKSIIDESNIDKKQSNLYYLKEYLSQLNDA